MKKLSLLEFVYKAKDIHGDRYDYSLVNYINNYTKVKIICRKHGIFEQTPHSHLSMKSGCPKCKSFSKAENIIELLLKKYNIKFEIQKRFNDCKNKKPLPFDFYLPDYNTCIEYDGEQHFRPFRFKNKEKAIKKLQQTQYHDQIKINYCKNNNINLIKISYIYIKDINNIIRKIIGV